MLKGDSESNCRISIIKYSHGTDGGGGGGVEKSKNGKRLKISHQDRFGSSFQDFTSVSNFQNIKL